MADFLNFIQEVILYDGIMHDLVFVLIALVTIVSALCVVFMRNIVHSALFLVLSFLGVAAVYFQLSEGFLALVQIMVYAGAISILILFAIMLVMDREPKDTNLSIKSIKKRLFSGYVVFLLVLFLGIAIFATDWPVVEGAVSTPTLNNLASLLFGDYMVVMQVAAVLIVVAVIGALILTKGTDEK